MLDLNKDLQKFFPSLGIDKLKSTQESIISSVLNNGNTLGIMQTGGGKTLAYWMAGLELNGITIVISPLTSLIAEQAEKIRKQNYEVLEIHSGIDAVKQIRILKDFANKKLNPKFVFLSPEKIATDGLLEKAFVRRKNDIKLFVVDEVHCVSQWGMSFRPFYQRIPDFLNEIYKSSEYWPKILALTATVNAKELCDICSYFKIPKENIIRQDLSMRSEIQLHIEKCENEKEKEEKFWNIIKMHENEKILVYVYRKYSKNSVVELCDKARLKGIQSAYFHGDMTAKERQLIINKFKDNEVSVIFATNAFGMGIDIPDIRVIVHYMIPESCEQYYQEIGRAARDGKSANAYLLYSDKNIAVKNDYFIDNSFPTEEKLHETFTKLHPQDKIGLCTLNYFEDEDIQQCLPYYLEAGIVKIICKGFSRLSCLNNIKDAELQRYCDSSKTKLFATTVKKNNISPAHLAELVYDDFFDDKVDADKAFERSLILDIADITISNEQMQNMLKSIESKKSYKHGLLDYFVYLLENCENQQHLHQEIAYYLGTDKHQLNRIYTTLDGNRVRSKSEVLISNELYHSGIKYEYERKLFYADNRWIEPDFTIILPEKGELYWEHLGMLGNEEYDARWLEKMDIYDTFFKDKLIKTYESGVLSKDIEDTIMKITNLLK